MVSEDFEALRAELEGLNAHSVVMNEELASLATSLQHVNRLQEQQQRMEATARLTSSRVEEVAATAVTHDDLDELTRLRRRATRNFYVACSVGIVSALGVGLGGLAAASAYHKQQQTFLHSQYGNCLIRNSQVAASKELVEQLIQAEQHNVDATQLITTLRSLASQQKTVDCAALLRG